MGLTPGAFPSTTTTEHTLLLALALKWKQVNSSLSARELKDFEKKIWLCHIRATVEAEAKMVRGGEEMRKEERGEGGEG